MPLSPEMDAAEIAAKLKDFEADISARSSRIAELEARVSLLEAENTRLRNAMPNGEAMDHSGKRRLASGRLEEGLGGNKQKPVDMVGGRLLCDVTEVSDGEEEARGAEEGVLVVPSPRKCGVVTGESDDEDDIRESGGGGGGDHESVLCDDNVGLEDDDVSIRPRSKKRRAARVITSDSDDEDGNDKDGEVQEKEVGVTPSRKRALRGVSDSEQDEGELGESNGCSTRATRRSARLVDSQSKRVRDTHWVLDFGEPKDCEGSEDDLEEDDGMDEFIDDADCSENSADCAEESSAEPEECDSGLNYKDVMDDIGRKRNVKTMDWEYEADMLSAFAEHPELRLKAVCALYRKETEKQKSGKALNKQGFNLLDAPRGSHTADFLLDGDAFGPLKKTAHDLEKYDRYALEFCHKMALRYSKQLFAIYQNKEDPYFP